MIWITPGQWPGGSTFTDKAQLSAWDPGEHPHLWSGEVFCAQVLTQVPDMPSAGLEILGVTLAVLGWILAIISCVLPMWRVSAFVGMNIVTAQITWEGIWMNCVVQSTGQMQCKVHDSMLALSADLQAARALTIISIVVGIVGLLVAMVGAKCTNCVDEESAKARVMIAAGAAFIVASLTQLIPVSWCANSIIMEFYSPLTPESQKKEIGAALYLGWAAAAFLLIGGGILCSSCPPQPEKRYGPPSKMTYPVSRSIAPSGYDRRDYVWARTCRSFFAMTERRTDIFCLF